MSQNAILINKNKTPIMNILGMMPPESSTNINPFCPYEYWYI